MQKSKEFLEQEQEYKRLEQIEKECEDLKRSIQHIGPGTKYQNSFLLHKEDYEALLQIRLNKISNSNKPIAIEITSWPPCTEIIYACPRCKADFRFFSSKEKFGHNCGLEINSNVKLHLAKPFNKDDYEAEQRLLQELNKKQRSS